MCNMWNYFFKHNYTKTQIKLNAFAFRCLDIICLLIPLIFCKLYCYVLLCSKYMKNDENKIKEKTLCFHLNQDSATTETTGTRFTKLP